MSRTSRTRMLAGFLLGCAAVFSAVPAEGAPGSSNWRWERAQRTSIREIKHYVITHARRGDSGNTPMESRWFVILLRDRNLKGQISPRSYNLRFTCVVQYLKVQGPDAAARTVADFLAGAEPFHVRDFKALQFVDESNADQRLAMEKAADDIRLGKPVRPDATDSPNNPARP